MEVLVLLGLFAAFVGGTIIGYYAALFQYAGSVVLQRLLADCTCADCVRR